MLKINLITQAEQDRLDKLRAVHQFYLDNYNREYMRRIRIAKINKAFEICRAVIELMAEIMNTTQSIKGFVAAKTKLDGGVHVSPVQKVINKVEDIKRQSELD